MIWGLLLLVISTICLFSFLRKKYNSVLGAITIVLFFIFFSDGYFNGIDWVNYYYGFLYNKTIFDFTLDYEPFFALMLFLFKNLFHDFYFSIIAYYIVVFVFLFYFSKKISNAIDVNMSVFIFLMVFLNGIELWNDQLRQAMAVVFSVGSVYYLIQNKNRYFFITCLFATMFHFSAIVTLFIYPAIFLRKKKILILGLSVFSTVVLLTIYPQIMIYILSNFGIVGAFLAKKMDIYIDRFSFKFGFVSVVDCVIILYYVVHSKYKDDCDRLLWNGVFLAAVLHLSFYFFPIFQRFNPYFFIFYCLLTTRRYYQSNLKLDRIIITICVMVISMTVNINYYTSSARPEYFRGYFIAYLFDSYNLDSDKYYRCGKFESSDFNFCRW